MKSVLLTRKETLLMTHDSTSRQSTLLPVPQSEQLVACLTDSCQALMSPAQRRGRPATLSALHLCLGIMLCGLRGFGAQLKLWRLLCLEPVGPFLPVHVGDQAVYNRLERAAGLMATFFEQVSPTGYVYDFPTSSEGWFLYLVDSEKTVHSS